MQIWQFLYFLFNKYKTGCIEAFISVDVLKPNVLKPDVLKPDIL